MAKGPVARHIDRNIGADWREAQLSLIEIHHLAVEIHRLPAQKRPDDLNGFTDRPRRLVANDTQLREARNAGA